MAVLNAVLASATRTGVEISLSVDYRKISDNSFVGQGTFIYPDPSQVTGAQVNIDVKALGSVYITALTKESTANGLVGSIIAI